ncbi:hypothetical protein PPE03_04060 [Pseudoalteromonas peptidolytica]|nr:hypothetical protein PPE03_04060 [Pseudoalteromonas peptidolytica]
MVLYQLALIVALFEGVNCVKISNLEQLSSEIFILPIAGRGSGVIDKSFLPQNRLRNYGNWYNLRAL